jgi:hypothetical protein
MDLRRPAVVMVSIFLVGCGFARSPQPQTQPENRAPQDPPATTAAAKSPAPVKTTGTVGSGGVNFDVSC